ncbi:MAG: hypothetical protein ACYCV7_06340 [Acidimicrobiales bacterium]
MDDPSGAGVATTPAPEPFPGCARPGHGRGRVGPFSRAQRGASRITRRRLQIGLGLLWLLDGALQLQPYMYSKGSDGFLGPISENTMGPPNPITDLIRSALTVFVAHQVETNIVITATQLGIGIGLLWSRTARLALAGSFVWGLGVWVVGEGVGQLLFPQASMLTGTPGAALVYVLLAVVLWPRRSATAGDSGAVADRGLMGRRGSRWLWAALWCGTALLELEYANRAPDAISAQIRNGAVGQPWLLAAVDREVAHMTHGEGIWVAGLLLLVQFVVGWWALRDRTVKPALFVGVTVTLIFWLVGQNLGSILTGHGTDPNLGPPMVLFALALWPVSSVADQGRRVRRGSNPARTRRGHPTITLPMLGKVQEQRNRLVEESERVRVLVLGGDGCPGWSAAPCPSGRRHQVGTVDNFAGRRCDSELGLDSPVPDTGMDQQIHRWRGIADLVALGSTGGYGTSDVDIEDGFTVRKPPGRTDPVSFPSMLDVADRIRGSADIGAIAGS